LESLSNRIAAWWAWLLGRWKQRPLHYWAFAIASLILSFLLAPILDQPLHLISVRYWLFQTLSQSATNPSQPTGGLRVLLIDDDEYWKWDGLLAHRTPTNRKYIAMIVDALDKAGASTIALDFDMRLPDTRAPGKPGDYDKEIEPPYREETEVLIHSIDNAAQNRAVVLSRTVYAGYRLGTDIYQPYGLCVSPSSDDPAKRNPGAQGFALSGAAPEHISCGYIALPRDMRQVPPRLPLEEGGWIDSFSYAVVQAADPDTAPDIGEKPAYATYILTETLQKAGVIVWARDLLSKDPAKARNAAEHVRGKTVIVGAGWHKLAKGFGDLVDAHLTPIEDTNGAVIHANFALAVMSHRFYPAVSEGTLRVLEVAAGVISILFFALFNSIWVRLGTLIGAIAALFAIQWLSLQVLGTFFEAFIPVFGVGLHAVVERIGSRD